MANRAEHLGSRSGQGEPEGRKLATKQFDGDLKDIDKAIQNTAIDAATILTFNSPNSAASNGTRGSGNRVVSPGWHCFVTRAG